MNKKFKNFLNELKEHIWTPFVHATLSPHFIALSTAVGIGAGLMPIFGQVWVCGIIWVILRRWSWGHFSIIISGAWTFISNPLTTPMLVYIYYVIGQKFLGKELLTFKSFIYHARDIIEQESGFGDLVKSSVDFLVSDIGIPILIGFPFVIAVVSPLSYLGAYFLAERLRIRRIRKLYHERKSK